jgi:hypothetical protein
MTSGPVLFARYAIPPNARGLCGPADSAALRGYAAAGQPRHDCAHHDLARLARDFAGAWPYLQLIAACNRIDDPLDARVVEAYWVGSELLDNVPMPAYGDFLDERFRHRAGRHGWAAIAGTITAGAVPHHSFHVFVAYPWTGLLRAGRTDPSLQVLDSCRISWGQVICVDPLVVLRRPLTWDGLVLGLGQAVPCQVDPGLSTGLRPGDWVSQHWDCACDRLTLPQLRALRAYTIRHLRLCNQASTSPALLGGALT